jgi:hypothetical protein
MPATTPDHQQNPAAGTGAEKADTTGNEDSGAEGDAGVPDAAWAT